MPRLLNRQHQIPHGMRFHQPQTNWSAPQGSFDAIVRAVISHRQGNRHISARYKLSTDYETVANEVDNYNAQICLNHGWHDYIMGDYSPPKMNPPYRSFSNPPVAAGSVRKAVAGVKIYADWLGDSLNPVEHALAEKRASVCLNCKENRDPNWIQKMEAALANKFKTLIGIKNDLELTTSHDAQLHSCQVCDCPLTVKVHVPLKHILKETNEKTMAALKEVQPPCWIVTESA